MTSLVDPVELRQGVLAVSVLDEIDITPQRRCVMLHGFPEVSVPWSQLATVNAFTGPA